MKKTSFTLFLAALLAAAGCAAYVEGPPLRHDPASTVQVSLFYQDLAAYGDWLWVDPWGWVWTPWDVEAGWRPYTQGHWAWTPLGWTWVSDWAWGWAPFHYGRWTYHAHHGWIWIPDTVWAPAWVAWRSGHGWIGWAPLPPDARWRVGIGLDLGGVDLTLGIAQHGWSFVREPDFTSSRIWRRLEPLPRNRHLLDETEDRTRYEQVDRRVAGRGIGIEEIERNAGPVRRYRPEDLEKPPPAAGEGAPPQQPPPSVDKEPPERRAAREQRDVRAWEQEELQRLDQAQRRERRQPPPDETVVQLERRHESERRALQKEVEREKQLVENRRDRRAQEKAKAKEKQKQSEPGKPPGGGEG